MKTLFLITVFLLLCQVLSAPEFRTMLIEEAKKYDPFKRVKESIGWVESRHNNLAYNPREEATGYFQIRPIRLRDYNERAGDSLTIDDMFDYRKAEKVFMYFAVRIGHRNTEEIILQWNCRSKEYLKRVMVLMPEDFEN